MRWWDERTVELYLRAESKTNFHRDLAALIDEVIPKKATIAELGCGLGFITDALAGKGRSIEGYDNDPLAIETAERLFPNRVFHLADCHRLPRVADWALLVFFGRITEEDNLERLLSSCLEGMCVVVNEHMDASSCPYDRTREVSRFLTERRIEHSATTHHLRFDQPLLSLEEAEEIEELSMKRRKATSKRDVVATNDTEHPYSIKVDKAFGIVAFEKPKGDGNT